MKLKSLEKTELTPYVVELLGRQEINTLYDFLQADLSRLEKITNLSRSALVELNKKLVNYYLPTPERLSAAFAGFNKIYYGFGITCLDSILGEETLFAGSVFEITGIAGGIGKTQFCHTIIVDLLQRHEDFEALYIDTKNDFSATRCFQMLIARNVDKAEIGSILQRIIVEDCFDSYSVIKVLENIRKDLETTRASRSNKIKLIVIDSLSIWFLHTFSDDDDVRIQGKYLLAKFANCMYHIAKAFGMSFLLVNLMVCKTNAYPNLRETAEDGTHVDNVPSQDDVGPSDAQRREPALGRYWRRIPRVRLLLKARTEGDEHPFLRCIEVVKSCYGLTGSHCFVKISDAGVVDDDSC